MIHLQRDERVLIGEWDAPPVNVLDGSLLQDIAIALHDAAREENLSAVLLRGAGRCFSAGASVAENVRESAPAMLDALTDACESMLNLPCQAVAQVHGSCLGGALELALFCDFIVADPEARMGVPEIQLAFYPPLAVAALPGRVGHANAAWMILTGETLSAVRAQELGLVQELLPKDRWSETAARFNGLSCAALRLAKQRVRTAARHLPTLARNENRVFLEEIYSGGSMKACAHSSPAKAGGSTARHPDGQHRRRSRRARHPAPPRIG